MPNATEAHAYIPRLARISFWIPGVFAEWEKRVHSRPSHRTNSFFHKPVFHRSTVLFRIRQLIQ